MCIALTLNTFTPVWGKVSASEIEYYLPHSMNTHKPPLTTEPSQGTLCGTHNITQTINLIPVPVMSENDSHEKNITDGSPTLIAIITAAAGIFGALSGGFASYLIARTKAKSDFELENKRLQANLIATERLRWLQDIRNRLSNLYVKLDMQYSFCKRTNYLISQTSIQKKLDEMSSEIMEQCNMITLMLNPNKPDQKILYNTIQDILNFMLVVFDNYSAGKIVFDDEVYLKYKTLAFEIMAKLGNETWTKIKSLS